MTARIDRLSDSQANAEAVARRDRAYLSEHYASKRPRSRPRGLVELLDWFEAEWHDQAPDRLHKRELWHDYILALEGWRRQGGGSAIGSKAWSDGMRRLLEAPRSQDPDGFYLHPLAAALRGLERRDAFMAMFLRAVALAGFEVSPVGLRLGWPESVVMVYSVEALERLWRCYREEAPARPLTAVVGEAVSSQPSDELSLTDVSGAGVPSQPAEDATLSVAVPGYFPVLTIIRRIA